MAHRRAKALGSVSSAAGLFSSENDDFFSSLAPTDSSNHLGTRGIGTVFEEEEPISPRIPSSNSNQSQQQNQHQQQYSSQNNNNQDWSNHSYQSNEPQQQSYQYSNNDNNSNNNNNYANQESYNQSETNYSQNDYSSQHALDQNSDSYAVQDDYVEPPYYYGYIYDPVSNTYLPDPDVPVDESWNGEEQTQESEVDQGVNQDHQSWNNNQDSVEIQPEEQSEHQEYNQPEPKEEVQNDYYQNQNYSENNTNDNNNQYQQQQDHSTDQYQAQYSDEQQDADYNQSVVEPVLDQGTYNYSAAETSEYDNNNNNQYDNNYSAYSEPAAQNQSNYEVADQSSYQSYEPQSNNNQAYEQSPDDFYSQQYQQSTNQNYNDSTPAPPPPATSSIPSAPVDYYSSQQYSESTNQYDAPSTQSYDLPPQPQIQEPVIQSYAPPPRAEVVSQPTTSYAPPPRASISQREERVPPPQTLQSNYAPPPSVQSYQSQPEVVDHYQAQTSKPEVTFAPPPKSQVVKSPVVVEALPPPPTKYASYAPPPKTQQVSVDQVQDSIPSAYAPPPKAKVAIESPVVAPAVAPVVPVAVQEYSSPTIPPVSKPQTFAPPPKAQVYQSEVPQRQSTVVSPPPPPQSLPKQTPVPLVQAIPIPAPAEVLSNVVKVPQVLERRPSSPFRTKSIPPPPRTTFSPTSETVPLRPASSSGARERNVFTPPPPEIYPSMHNNIYMLQNNYPSEGIDDSPYSFSSLAPSVSTNDYSQPMEPIEEMYDVDSRNSEANNQNWNGEGNDYYNNQNVHESGQAISQETNWNEPIDTSTVNHDDDAANRATESLESPTQEEPPFRPTWEDYRMQSASPSTSLNRTIPLSADTSYTPQATAQDESLISPMSTLALGKTSPQPTYHQESPPQPLFNDYSNTRKEVESIPEPIIPQPYVPEVSIEAPSPVIEEDYNYDETRTPEGYQQNQYDNQQNQYDTNYAEDAAVNPYAPSVQSQAAEPEYGFDDSQVFEEEDLSQNNAASGYGEWNGQSDAGQGYDYVNSYEGGSYGEQAQQQQQPSQSQPQTENENLYYQEQPSSFEFVPTTAQSQSDYQYQDTPYNPVDNTALSPTQSPYESSSTFEQTSYSNNNDNYNNESSYQPSPSNDDNPYSQFAAVQLPNQSTGNVPQNDQTYARESTSSYGTSRALSPTAQSQYQSSSQQSIDSVYTSPKKQSAQLPYSPTNESKRTTYNSPPVSLSPTNQQSNNFDSYAPYSPPAPAALAPTSLNQADPYSTQGNMTAPSTYGSNELQSQQQYSSYTPYTTKVDRRYSFDATPANYTPAMLEPLTRQTVGRGGGGVNVVAPIANLGLERCKAPVISFAFGGRMLVVFADTSVPSYGQIPTGNSSSVVHIRKVDEVLPPDELASFPGPMFMDGGKANAGKKRKEALSWLDGRIVELEKENVHRHSGAFGKVVSTKEDAKLILVQLVRALVENEGKLSGTPKIDELVRLILSPNSATDVGEPEFLNTFQSPTASPLPNGSTKPIATYEVTSSDLDRMSAFLLRGERRKAVRYALDHKLWAQALVISSCVDTNCWQEVVNAFLRCELGSTVEGQSGISNGREGLRVAYAMFAGLNGRDSIQQFLPPTMTHSPSNQSLHPQAYNTNNPISRAATPITPGFVEVIPSKDVSPIILEKWQETAAMIVANRFLGDSPAITLSALGDTLLANDWIDAAHVCFLLAPLNSAFGMGSPSARIALLGSSPPDSITSKSISTESIILTELVEFAFSLAPSVKSQEPFVGFPHFQAFRLLQASRLADAGHITQAHKYAEAIVNTLKLATKPSPFYNSELVDQVKSLTDRLNSAPGHDKGASWITRNVPRPTIDSLWSTMEGRFSKFVSGDGEAKVSSQLRLAASDVSKPNPSAIGPFSHYSTISPASTSGTLSRSHSQSDLFPAAMQQQQVPQVPQIPRAFIQSEASFTPPRNRPRPSSQSELVLPPPRPTSASSSHALGPPPVNRANYMTHHVRSSSLGFAGYNYDPNAPPPWQSYEPNDSPSGDQQTTPKALAQEFPDSSQSYMNNNYASTNYGQSEGYNDNNGNNGYYGNDQGGGGGAGGGSSTSMLRVPSFTPLEESFAEDESGFISPMAAYTPSPSPGFQQTSAYSNLQSSHKRTSTREELDELGIGNSKSRKPTFDSIDEHAGEGEDGVVVEQKQQQQQSDNRQTIKPAKSWLGGWFKREASPSPVHNGPGPVKANLGEQTSFVYDPDLKRWVNKKVGDTGSATLATAPPPRAATTSPTSAARAHMPPSRYQSGTPPPLPSGPMPPFNRGATMPPSLNRARTSADLSGDNSRAGEFRSASVGPTPMGGLPPPRPNSAAAGGPPLSRSSTPGGGPKRKPLAKRYVAIN